MEQRLVKPKGNPVNLFLLKQAPPAAHRDLT
jgi:hypothetical protein